MILLWLACAEPVAPPPAPSADLLAHCEAAIGPPQVRTLVPGQVHVATGFDLANTILVQTPAGNVVIDAGMTPGRALQVRAALEQVAPGPVAALVFTHSHIDHVGGASAWAGADTPIWATAAFADHFFQQYGRFQPLQARRAARQYGRDLGGVDPCTGLGALLDWEGLRTVGPRLPTRTFSGRADLDLGGVHLELFEAHGETDDQLFAWLPEQSVLFPGDNFYRAFPNLSTLRGSRPRPADEWIRSLDAMRRLDPAVLVPSHTAPIVGRQEVRAALTAYRDAIQWVRDEVVRGANRDLDPATLAATVRLPPHLAARPELAELYGQVDWSVRAIYSNELGWFSGRSLDVHPLSPDELGRRSVAAMGGAEAVLAQVAASDDPAWSLHLLGLLRDSGALPSDRLDPLEAAALTELAVRVPSSNGRSWLLQSALEHRSGAFEHRSEAPQEPPPTWDETFIDSVPVATIFEVMTVRLRPERAAEVHESVEFVFTDSGERFVVTVRQGVAELVAGEALPGGPPPLARVLTDGPTWRRLALGIDRPLVALADGRLRIDGDPAGFVAFLSRFEQR